MRELRQPNHEGSPEPPRYEPPKAEDIDTTQNPAETSAAIVYPLPPTGIEESARWH